MMEAYHSQTLKNLLEKHLSKVLNGLTTTSIYLHYSIVKWVYVDNLLPNSKQLKGDEK